MSFILQQLRDYHAHVRVLLGVNWSLVCWRWGTIGTGPTIALPYGTRNGEFRISHVRLLYICDVLVEI